MRPLFKRIRFLFSIRKSIPFMKDFFTSREVSGLRKILFVCLIIGYIVFPFDLIPDFFLGIGLVDDVAVALLMMQLMIKVSPPSLKEKYGKGK